MPRGEGRARRQDEEGRKKRGNWGKEEAEGKLGERRGGAEGEGRWEGEGDGGGIGRRKKMTEKKKKKNSTRKKRKEEEREVKRNYRYTKQREDDERI